MRERMSHSSDHDRRRNRVGFDHSRQQSHCTQPRTRSRTQSVLCRTPGNNNFNLERAPTNIGAHNVSFLNGVKAELPHNHSGVSNLPNRQEEAPDQTAAGSTRVASFKYFAEHAAIYWHPTTIRRFQCESGCIHCCLQPFYFPSEVNHLPDTIKNALVYKGDPHVTMPKHLENIEGTCTFFKKNRDTHCGIFPHRPLRCRLYPYLPLIEKNRITIVLEPFLKPSKGLAPCFGINKGSNISSNIENLARKFVAHILCEYPFLLQDWAVEDVDHLIDYSIVAKYQNPKYRSWQEARPVIQRRLMLKMQQQLNMERPNKILEPSTMRYLAYMPTQS